MESTTTGSFFKQVVDCVYAYYKLNGEDYLDKNRRANTIRAKHVSIYIIISHSKFGPSEVARYFGITHASALHACKKIKTYISYDRLLQAEITEIEMGLSIAPNIAVRLSETKQIILKGFTKKEIEEFMLINNPKETTIITLSYNDEESVRHQIAKKGIIQQHSEVLGRA